MDSRKSREGAVEFQEYLAQKGLMEPATARARKAAVNTVLAILDVQEAQDVTAIDIDEVMRRFANLQGKDYNPATLRTYKSRVRSALDDFRSYIENPLAFKPSLQARERKSSSDRPASSPSKANSDVNTSELTRPTVSALSGPMASSILPIPIRADLTIHVQGLPFDLTEAEAKKIANVVLAMAMSR
jgi:hypothetical protein